LDAPDGIGKKDRSDGTVPSLLSFYLWRDDRRLAVTEDFALEWRVVLHCSGIFDVHLLTGNRKLTI
jgi:hypothetical protein